MVVRAFGCICMQVPSRDMPFVVKPLLAAGLALAVTLGSGLPVQPAFAYDVPYASDRMRWKTAVTCSPCESFY